MLKLALVRDELANGEAAGTLIQKYGEGLQPGEVFNLAIQWILNVDPITVEAKRAEWQAQQDMRADTKRRKDAERQALKDEAAQAKLISSSTL